MADDNDRKLGVRSFYGSVGCLTKLPVTDLKLVEVKDLLTKFKEAERFRIHLLSCRAEKSFKELSINNRKASS